MLSAEPPVDEQPAVPESDATATGPVAGTHPRPAAPPSTPGAPSSTPPAPPPLPPLDLPRAAPALPPLPSAVPRPPAPTGRRRGAAVAGVVVAVLIAAAAVGGVAWERHRDTPVAAVTPVAPVAVAPSATPAAESSPAPAGGVPAPVATVTVTAPAAPAPSSTPAQRRYSCWNGRRADDLADCGTPAAAAGTAHPLSGLNWVFPDRGAPMEAAGATCYDEPGGNHVAMRTCSMTFDAGTVCSHWTQWHTGAAAMRDYRNGGTPTSTTAGTGTVLTWPAFALPGTSCDGKRWAYKTSRMVKGQPWGVTFYASEAAAANDAMARFGSMRPLDQWLGVAAQPARP